MKKYALASISLVGFLCLISGCTSIVSSSQSSSTSSENHLAVFSGVQDAVSIHLGETFPALDGVTVLDEEDGDLTSSIILSSIPTMVNNDGVFAPDAEGDYYVTYSVTDSGGLVSEAYSTLTVLEAVPTETLYQNYQFVTGGSLNMGGWAYTFSGDATGTVFGENGNLAIDVSNLGTTNESVLFYKEPVSVLAGTDYQLKIYMSSSVATTATLSVANLIDGLPEDLASSMLSITTLIATYELAFTPTIASDLISFRLALGGSQNTEIFKLSIALIELVATTGTEVETIITSDNFASSTEGWNYVADAGSSATLSVVNEALNFSIANYATENKPWNINLFRNTGADILKDHTYKVSMDISVTASQFYELCFENVAMDWQIRAGFKNGTFTDSITFTYTFTAAMNITGLYVKLALGQGSATTNLVTIDNFAFVEVTGDQNVVTTSKTFAMTAENDPWATFNSNGGLGEIYCEDGKLYYAVSAFGGSDWHNKFVIKSITLAALANYRFSFTISANKAISGSFIVNTVGTWNPQITETFNLTTEATTFSFAFDSALLDNLTVELLFQFGGIAANVAPAVICFSDISVFQIV